MADTLTGRRNQPAEWLTTLQPGDPVTYYPAAHSPEPERRTVAKITRTQIVLTTKGAPQYAPRMRRDTGKQVGPAVFRYDKGRWFWARIEPYTPEVAHRIAVRRAQRRLLRTDWTKLPDDIVLEIDARLTVAAQDAALAAAVPDQDEGGLR